MKYAWQILFVLGILIALFGVGIDYLVPGTSPGLNLPQLLIIVVGVALSFGALQLRRARSRGRILGGARQVILKLFLITLLTLLALEIAMAAWGLPTYYPSQIPKKNVEVVPWGLCDELGCRKHYEAVLDACAEGYLSGIRCVINRDGFGDTDEFVVKEDFPQRARILMLGDSYTRGFFR